MNPIQAKLKIYTYSLTALSAISALLYLLCYLFCFDADLHYFSSASPLPTIACAVLVLSLVWATTAFIFLPKNSLRPTNADFSTASTFGAALCGFVFLFYTGIDAFAALESGILYADQRTKILTLLGIASGFCSAIYFFLGLAPTLRRRDSRIILGFAPILWAVSTMALAYFDFSHPMNEPAKVTVMMGMVSIMLATLSELRTMLDRHQPRLDLFCHYAAILFCGVGGLAGAIAAPRYAAMAEYQSSFLLVTALWIYFLARTFDILRAQLAPVAAPADESEAAA